MVLRTVFRNARKTRDSQTKKRSMEVRLALTTLINHCANAGCTWVRFRLNIIIFLWTRRERNDNSTSSKTSKTV
ncbi:unnamed protein product, partial [Mesorhabditis spiculigera]